MTEAEIKEIVDSVAYGIVLAECLQGPLLTDEWSPCIDYQFRKRNKPLDDDTRWKFIGKVQNRVQELKKPQ